MSTHTSENTTENKESFYDSVVVKDLESQNQEPPFNFTKDEIKYALVKGVYYKLTQQLIVTFFICLIPYIFEQSVVVYVILYFRVLL